VGRYDYLTPEQEVDYARRWSEEGDREALDQLVGSHLRLVVKIARSFKGYGLPLADLISEGHVGLMQAARRFDPERGFRFATYARWWIRAEIQEYVLRSWSLVKMGTTAAQKKLFFNLRRLKSQMQAYEDGDLSPETTAAIAEELDVAESDVVDMNRRLGFGDQSLNVRSGTDTADELLDRLVEEADDQEAQVVAKDEAARRHELLEQGLIKLTEREQDILVKRRLRDDPFTLQVLGEEYGISRERVRQIERRAFEKLQAIVQEEALAAERQPEADRLASVH
jgi:RNA polymerase sigma-32 factor